MTHTEVPSKLPQLHAYVDPQLKKDVERLAKRRRRTVSSLIAYLVQLEIEKAKESGELRNEADRSRLDDLNNSDNGDRKSDDSEE